MLFNLDFGKLVYGDGYNFWLNRWPACKYPMTEQWYNGRITCKVRCQVLSKDCGMCQVVRCPG